MFAKLPKALLLFTVPALMFLFFACSSNTSEEDTEEISTDNNGYSDIIYSSSSATLYSSSLVSSSSQSSSSSAGLYSSSSAALYSSSFASSSSQSNSSSSVTTSSVGCNRTGLEAAVNSYLAALAAGNYALMPLKQGAKYIENDNTAKPSYGMGGSSGPERIVPFGQGLWEKAHAIDHHMNLIDVEACATFTEVVIASSNPQYILGTRLSVSDNEIYEVSVVVTKSGDWLFDADNYLKYSKGEDWSLLPADQRLSKQQLISDAEAYFAYFSDKSAEVPWGTRCARLEGGAYTGDYANSSCNVGVPDLPNRIGTIWALADPDYGMAVLFVYFGGADTHLFRILPTGYRYIHTLTAMQQSDYVQP